MLYLLIVFLTDLALVLLCCFDHELIFGISFPVRVLCVRGVGVICVMWFGLGSLRARPISFISDQVSCDCPG